MEDNDASEESRKEVFHQQLLRGELKISEKRGRSKVWTVFGRLVDANGDEISGMVACRTCQKLYKSSAHGTSNLVKHKCYVNSRGDLKKIDIDSERKRKITKAVTEWSVENCRPFSIVQDNGLRKVLNIFLEIGMHYG